MICKNKILERVVYKAILNSIHANSKNIKQNSGLKRNWKIFFS